MTFEDKPKAVKKLTLEQALIKAMKYCAYQERSQQEVRDKIYSYGLHKNDVENIIVKLIDHGFLKEERFAVAFASGKLRVKKWGTIKIKQALREKQVSEPLIKLAIATLDSNEYVSILKELISKKSKQISEKNLFKRNFKIAQYCISHGFEPDLVWDCLRVIE
jgi:regulatory protein